MPPRPDDAAEPAVTPAATPPGRGADAPATVNAGAVTGDAGAPAGRSWLAILNELTRVRITIAVTFTTATGYFIAAGPIDANFWMSLIGLFLLASGSTVLNQCQEHRIDARMERTRRRPIPSGELSLTAALGVAVLLMLLGFSCLASVEHNMPLLVGLGGLALFWYNGVYTYLKRVTAFAVVPGALIGAIPPVMGYVAAGGELRSPLILLVAGFFFIWQIPHFWLLLLMVGDQYGRAGLPTLTQVFAPRQLIRVTFMWLLATAAAGLAFPTLAGVELSTPWRVVIVAASVWLVLKAAAMLTPRAELEAATLFRKTFVRINIYALVVMICLSLDTLLV